MGKNKKIFLRTNLDKKNLIEESDKKNLKEFVEEGPQSQVIKTFQKAP